MSTARFPNGPNGPLAVSWSFVESVEDFGSSCCCTNYIYIYVMVLMMMMMMMMMESSIVMELHVTKTLDEILYNFNSSIGIFNYIYIYINDGQYQQTMGTLMIIT